MPGQRPDRFKISRSARRGKKLKAVFFKGTEKIKTVHFGGSGCKDFIKYSAIDPALAKRKRSAYIKRHRIKENWRDPMRAGTLSRYILWEKPTLERSIKKFAVVFKMNAM